MATLYLSQIFYPSVNILLKLVPKSDEERWASKAVLALANKLRKKKGALTDLEYALCNPGQPSKCVTISRSHDGRITVSHRKSHAHVIYCKVWRWPNLRNWRELTPLESCQFPFSGKPSKDLCINPYHYKRVECPELPPVFVPSHSEFTSQHSSFSFPHPFQTSVRPSNVSVIQHGFENENSRGSLSPLMFNHPVDSNGPSWSPYYHSSCSPHDSLPDDSPPPAYTLQGSAEDDAMETYSSKAIGNIQYATPIQYQEQKCWCKIAYYELSNRVGDMFLANCPSTVIDGFRDPKNSEERFCLGVLSNVNRNPTIDKTRRHIGRGVHLYYVGGEVYVECLSSASIFVQSRSCNYLNGWDFSTVCKVEPACTLKIFNDYKFYQLLNESVNSSYDYKAVSELLNMCTFKISFVKGWGTGYSRQDVTSTPCWVEIHLHGPQQWVDNVLIQMGQPAERRSSFS